MTQEEISAYIRNNSKVVIELGCGPHKKQGAIGIDRLALPGVDIVADLEEGLSFFPDNSVDEITSSHVLEHIDNLEQLLREIHRTLKPDGIKHILVPHFSNPYYYSDYTHKRFFGLYTFDYFSKHPQKKYKRRVPDFYVNFHFTVIKRRLIFKSPFYFRNLFKQVLNRIFNINPYMQELYEECFCYMLPCQEIEFVLRCENT